jgi:beta-glucanase (GH16 family)
MPLPTGSARYMTVAGVTAAALVLSMPIALAGRKPSKNTTTLVPTVAAVSLATPVRFVAGTTAVNDVANRSWAPDAGYAVGGSLRTPSTATIAGTYSSAIYDRARIGGSGYNIPVVGPGTFAVDLYLAETAGATAGQRVFNVTAEGQSVAQNVDVAAAVGQNAAYHVLFTVPVTDGTINVRFSPVAGQPLVSGVETYQTKVATSDSMLFADEFTGAAGASPDPLKWTYDMGPWGNGELENYTARPENASLDGNGFLNITARAETYTDPASGQTRNYTSARLKTANLFAFQYGKMEARIKTPAGKGLWPSFWALGSNFPAVSWPTTGEIDAMETIGTTPYKAYGTIHGATATGGHWQRQGVTASNVPGVGFQPISADYHVFGAVWTPDTVQIQMDGKPYVTTTVADAPANAVWSFNHPFFVLLNLAVGGDWGGPPDSTTPFPATMSVDWVHITG